MAFMGIFRLTVLVFFLSFHQYGVSTDGRSISKEEDLELERQLKILNKHPVKTLKNKVGDIYDCIDIKRQPTLDHPLYRNHKIQMQPSSVPEELIATTSLNEKHSMASLGTIDCPYGTVPIRRTRQEDLIRAKSMSDLSGPSIHPLTTEEPGRHYSILGLKADDGTFNGIKGYVSLYNLTVGANQSSSSQLWIQNGSGDQVNSLQAGWMVSPQLYGDSFTRSFIRWGTDALGSNNRGCYNLLCPGFVQVNSKIPVDNIFTKTTIPDGDQYVIYLSIFKVSDTGDWWLQGNGMNIGYWPNTLVPRLNSGATLIAWGGRAQGLPNGPSPPMGSGYKMKDHDTKSSAHFHQLQYIGKSSNTWVTDDLKRLGHFVNSSNCYQLFYYGYIGKDLGYIFTYGGPGGVNCGP